MSWTAEQQRLLGALGYTLYRRGAPVVAPAAPASASAMPSESAAARAASGTVDTLFAALQRAAAGRDITALAVDIDALRRNPTRKRALWPALRALRRAH
jgi:hypothetical protein